MDFTIGHKNFMPSPGSPRPSVAWWSPLQGTGDATSPKRAVGQSPMRFPFNLEFLDVFFKWFLWNLPIEYGPLSTESYQWKHSKNGDLLHSHFSHGPFCGRGFTMMSYGPWLCFSSPSVNWFNWCRSSLAHPPSACILWDVTVSSMGCWDIDHI